MTLRAYQRMLAGGAVWNVAGAVFLFGFTGWIFGRSSLRTPDPPVFYFTWLAFCVVFGLGYYAASRDPLGHVTVVRMGIVGKLAFAAIFLWQMATRPGSVPSFFLVPILGDLYFVVRFAMFLRVARRASAGVPAART